MNNMNIKRPLRLPLRFSERRRVLMGLDLLAINGALLFCLTLQAEDSFSWKHIIGHPLWFIILTVLWLLLAYAFDAYDLRIAGTFSKTLMALLKAEIIPTGIYLL